LLSAFGSSLVMVVRVAAPLLSLNREEHGNCAKQLGGEGPWAEKCQGYNNWVAPRSTDPSGYFEKLFFSVIKFDDTSIVCPCRHRCLGFNLLSFACRKFIFYHTRFLDKHLSIISKRCLDLLEALPNQILYGPTTVYLTVTTRQ